MFIADPRVDEEGREALVEKVKKVITEKAVGTIEKVDRWGIRKLAYKLPKTKLTEGDYTV
ncbi:MAG TPA: 30S ribosomal protein S6, partial [Thermotogota bacterium]|nr:30S ribosomal protein S6 [Thermotogota bacterium]